MTLKLLNFKISFWKNAVEINKWIKTINIWGVSISSVVYNIQVNKQLRSRELQSMHFSLISFLSGLLASIYSFTDKVIWNSYQFHQIRIQWTQKPPETFKFCEKKLKNQIRVFFYIFYWWGNMILLSVLSNLSSVTSKPPSYVKTLPKKL